MRIRGCRRNKSIGNWQQAEQTSAGNQKHFSNKYCSTAYYFNSKMYSSSKLLFLRAACRGGGAARIINPSTASRWLFSSSAQQLHRALPHAIDIAVASSNKRPFSSSSTAAAEKQQPPFNKILIANRGEITLRIIRTAQSLGIQTVAIYSTADAKSLHVQMADEAVCIGPPASSASYLDIDKVCEAIILTGAEGVHPGYGFLSENSSFAERVEQLSVVGNNNNTTTKKVKFIGPSTHAIHSLGDKIQSKLIAEAAGVSIIPGYNGVVTSPDHAVEIAHDLGYPVMIKASSGGGGKGMRICYTDDQVKEGYRLGSAEAKSFFGDDRLLVEKYVEDPHHIEIQVLSGQNPKTGELDILCFAERECSIQRRNQKVIEESPSPHLLPETRRKMIREVKSLVREVHYESAGTVSFVFFVCISHIVVLFRLHTDQNSYPCIDYYLNYLLLSRLNFWWTKIKTFTSLK
jgi:propionyl-CoA carboxylase alpha chain